MLSLAGQALSRIGGVAPVYLLYFFSCDLKSNQRWLSTRLREQDSNRLRERSSVHMYRAHLAHQ